MTDDKKRPGIVLVSDLASRSTLIDHITNHIDKTVLVINNALRQRRLEAENRALRARVDRTQTMIGESYAVRQLRGGHAAIRYDDHAGMM